VERDQPPQESEQILSFQILLSNSPRAFARRALRARAVLLKLDGDVFDGRQRAENMNFLVRRVDVNLQFSVMRANADVLIMIHNFDEVGIRVLLQLFDDGMKNGYGFTRLFGSVAPVLVRHKCMAIGTAAAGTHI